MSHGDVRSFYKDKNVLLTGGTGFFGKMIIEKLLRSCDVEGIYLIVRPKKGLTPEERLKSFFEDPVLSKVRDGRSKYFEKLHTIEGNLNKKGLGLCEEDKEIIKNKINIVFHCGASLNMNSKIGDAVDTNVRGTLDILELLKDNKNLCAFVQVSTAYSNCCEKVIEEKFYKAPIDPELLVKMNEEINPDMLSTISPGLVGKWPNSYVFTKAVSENLLITKAKNLPVGLFRPAIVTATAREPLPGWSDNLYGPLGILLSTHCGILRVIRASNKLKSHTVPGDLCINAILCFAWDLSHEWQSSKNDYIPPVMNYSAQNTKLYITNKEYNETNRKDYPPFKKAMWYQVMFMVENKFCYDVLKFFLHTIPAYIIDLFLVLSARRARMKTIYAKLEKNSDILSFFLINEWDIHNDNVQKLWTKLSQRDKETFNFDINSLDMDIYFNNMMTGLKKYVLKEDMTKTKLHKQRYKRLSILHHTLKYALICLATIPVYKFISGLIFNKRNNNY